MNSRRIGFYPICARDYLEPLVLLKEWVDELIFCDIKCMPQSGDVLKSLRKTVADQDLPNPSFFIGDALIALHVIKPVDVFIIRRDNDGEGGSELNLLGPKHITDVVGVIQPGGLLITDRSCGRLWFQDFEQGRRNPYRIGNRAIQLSPEQQWKDHGLLSFIVS